MKGRWPWWKSRAEIAREVEEELRFHLELRARDLMREGMGAAEAAEEAHRRFGDVGRIADECREIGERMAAGRGLGRMFQPLTWVLFGAGVALQIIALVIPLVTVFQVGRVLMLIGLLWRALLYLRSVPGGTLPAEPAIKLDLADGAARRVPAYDERGRTPVERLFDEE